MRSRLRRRLRGRRRHTGARAHARRGAARPRGGPGGGGRMASAERDLRGAPPASGRAGRRAKDRRRAPPGGRFDHAAAAACRDRRCRGRRAGGCGRRAARISRPVDGRHAGRVALASRHPARRCRGTADRRRRARRGRIPDGVPGRRGHRRDRVADRGRPGRRASAATPGGAPGVGARRARGVLQDLHARRLRGLDAALTALLSARPRPGARLPVPLLHLRRHRRRHSALRTGRAAAAAAPAEHPGRRHGRRRRPAVRRRGPAWFGTRAPGRSGGW